MSQSHFLLYAKGYTEQFFLDDISLQEEAALWDEIARKSDVVNGWSAGSMRLVRTQKTEDNFAEIMQKYKSRDKRISRLFYFLKKVNVNDFFYVINFRYAKIAELLTPFEVFRSNIRNYGEWVSVHNKYFDIWSRISFEFDLMVYGLFGLNQCVGENDKSKRVCRFCGCTGADKFAHKAHAIPEALGNTELICYEECDKCNGELKSVEDNFIHLMDFRRAMYKIRSKKNTTESIVVYGKNYTIAPDKEGFPVLYIKRSCLPKRIEMDGSTSMKFHHYEQVIDQDIYRALAKMAIDLMPSDRLAHFKETINWIRHENKDVIPDALPSVYYGILPRGVMYEQPALLLFFRPEGDKDIPYCTAILFTTDIAYKFVVPFVDVDEGRFKYDEELQRLNSKIDKYFNIRWERQQFYSWWTSDIWNYWPLDKREYRICERDDNADVFKKFRRYNPKEQAAYDANIFHPGDINIEAVGWLEDSVSDSKSLITIGVVGNNLVTVCPFDIIVRFGDNTCLLKMIFKYIRYQFAFSISADIEVSVRRLDRINKHDKYITGETFHSLINSVFKKSKDRVIEEINQKFGIIINKNAQWDRCIETSAVAFVFDDGRIIKTSYESLVL